MTEYDDLERQLRRSVRARGAASPAGAAGSAGRDDAGTAGIPAGGAPPGAPDGGRRRARRWFGLLGVPVVLVAGAAGAAGLVGGPGTDEAAARLARAAVADTRRAPACRAPVGPGGAIEIPDRGPVDDAPLPQIARALPALVPRRETAAPAPGTAAARAAAEALATARRVATGAAVLRGTVRVARFADGGRVLAFVSTAGGAIPGPSDRTGCARLRRERLLRTLRRAVVRRGRADQGLYAFSERWPGAGPLVLDEYDAAGRRVRRERLRR